ncbi:sensor histidine kinase [bacterium]|nr:MAG: sensor histidine kinase [bacterium]
MERIRVPADTAGIVVELAPLAFALAATAAAGALWALERRRRVRERRRFRERLAALESTIHAGAARVVRRRELTRAILEISTTLLREHSISVVLDRLLAATLESFGFCSGAFYLRDSPDQPFMRAAIVGFPPARIGPLLGTVVDPRLIEQILAPEFRVRDTFYYVPGERARELAMPVALRRYPELADVSRSQPGAWQERDLIAFPFFDRHGRIIGLLTPDDPAERRFPNDEVIRAIEMFAALASVAVENARLATQRETAARRMAEVLRVSADLLAEERLDDLLLAILRAALRTFDLSGGEIALLDQERGLFVRRAVLGRVVSEPVGAIIAADEVARRLAAERRTAEGYYAAPEALTFPFVDASGRIIGFLAPELPHGSGHIANESARALQIFANFAGLAVARAEVRGLEIRQLRELEEIAQMKSDFVSTVSHELRTPLTSIKGFISVLIHRGDAVSAQQREEALQIVDGEADRLIRLVDDVLTTANFERGMPHAQLRTASVEGIVRRAIAAVAMEYPECRFVVRSHGEGLAAHTDPDHVLRILTNLLTNAAKYAGGSGEIAVEIGVEDEDVTVDVVDAGPGIPAADRERIFERFVRLDGEVRAHPGTGLGLYISRQLAQAVGGTLVLRESGGAGSCFRLTLRPCADAPPRHSSSAG